MAEALPTEDAGDEGGLTPVEALRAAVNAHRAGDFEVAEAIYGRILDVAPDFADALHFYGILHHQRGRSLEAVRLIRRAIDLDPDDIGKHMNLGNVLLEIDRPDLAMQAYRMTIVLHPGSVDARNNLGVALRAMRQDDEAETIYREALDLDPGHRDSWNNLGRLLAGTGRLDEATKCHARALELEPSNPHTRRQLLAVYSATRETDRAMKILKEWLADDPDSPSGHHLLAAFSGENVPDRASDAYVEGLFDQFASTFDHKLAILDYRVPEILGGELPALVGPARADLCVLDAGCGTGLCGPFLRPFADRLIGVDLSGKMLEKAAFRGGYDQLVQAELTQFLRDVPSTYDLILSADTLCYFGSLDEVIAASRGALRSGGHLLFSVEEELGPEEFRLHPHGRYAHRRDYVEAALRAAGFELERMNSEQLRVERAQPVMGLVVAGRAA